MSGRQAGVCGRHGDAAARASARAEVVNTQIGRISARISATNCSWQETGPII